MKVIGLCGGSGSGKGCVCSILSGYGFVILDTDKIYHKLLLSDETLRGELASAFGRSILSDADGIDRKRLGAIVFSDNTGEKLGILNKITHTHILATVRDKIAVARRENKIGCVVDAPLLFESGFDKECDTTLAVISDREKRISRIMLRDSIDRDAAIRRIDSQLDDEKLISLCDYTVFNNGDFDDLRKKVEKIACEIL